MNDKIKMPKQSIICVNPILSPVLSGFIIFPSPLLQHSLSPEARDLMNTSQP